ncbi:MAG: DUF3524 domain-containing protein [Pseudohongiellaceae bacterium]
MSSFFRQQRKKRILVLSAYDAYSHRQWREHVAAMLPDYDWVHLSLPSRHFAWRIRGNSLQWAFGKADLLRQQYDIILATSMVDLSSLRGFVPELARIPTIVYFHENQFVYPMGRRRQDNVEHKLVPIYTALCADCIVFNSHYNRHSFLEGARKLFNDLPDRIDPAIMNRLDASMVLPVPLAEEDFALEPLTRGGKLLDVAWNHRWEYDKGPELLLAVVKQACAATLPVRFHVFGQQFRQQPPAFAEMEPLLTEMARQQGQPRGQFGYLPGRQEYLECLRRNDVVLSTAHHDFQGLAMQEGCALGCTPLAPDALVYPEYLESAFLYPLRQSTEHTATEVVTRLKQRAQEKIAGQALPTVSMRHFLDAALRVEYRALIEWFLRRR